MFSSVFDKKKAFMVYTKTVNKMFEWVNCEDGSDRVRSFKNLDVFVKGKCGGDVQKQGFKLVEQAVQRIVKKCFWFYHKKSEFDLR